MGKGKKQAERTMCVSGERRVYKGHATKLCDWRGLCRPEPLRLDGDNVNVREAIASSSSKYGVRPFLIPF